MPYVIRKFKTGYKVCKKNDDKCFSKVPIPKSRAKKQLKAIGMSEGKSGGKRLKSFEEFLKNLGFNPKTYLKEAKQTAQEMGYNAGKLHFSDKPKYKLMYIDDSKKIHFGANGYGDFLIWRYLEKKNKAEKGTANKKRNMYIKRAYKTAERTNNPLSRANLSLKILW